MIQLSLKLVRYSLLYTVLWLLLSSQGAAFKPRYHDDITRSGIPQDNGSSGVDRWILRNIIDSNQESDLHQTGSNSWRHLDGARNPIQVCQLANNVWSRTFPVILEGSRFVDSPTLRALKDRNAAHDAFGVLLHALQDFYSHSNWVELGMRDAAPLFPICDASSLPAGLYTGYFDLNHLTFWAGCPYDVINKRWVPPTGYQECHATLNKDEPTSERGRQIIGRTNPIIGPQPNHFLVARDLAARHTHILYELIRGQVETTVSQDQGDVNPACVGRLLFANRPESCLDLTGAWVVTGVGFSIVRALALTHRGDALEGSWSGACSTLDGNFQAVTSTIRLTRAGQTNLFKGTRVGCSSLLGICPNDYVEVSLEYTGRSQFTFRYRQDTYDEACAYTAGGMVIETWVRSP